MGWITTEIVPVAAIGISALSLLISCISAWYARAQYKKRLADELPIIWVEPSERYHSRAIDLVVRNRSTSEIAGHSIEIVKPKGARIIPYWGAMVLEAGSYTFSPEKLAKEAVVGVPSKLVAKRAGTETTRHPHLGPDYGDTAKEAFFVHGLPSGDRPSTIVLRFTWSFKEETSRRRVAHVKIAVTADMKAAATVR